MGSGLNYSANWLSRLRIRDRSPGWLDMTIQLVCTGRKERRHKRVVVYRTEDGTPPWYLTLDNCNIELRCSRCRQASRPGRHRLPALLQLALDAGGELDLSPA